MGETNRVTKWQFKGEQGEFELENPQKTNGLYFPLANEIGMMSSITPILGGDIKTSQNTFLMQPVSAEDLHANMGSRNFWLNLHGDVIWSATGNSLYQRAKGLDDDSSEKVRLTGGFLWHKISIENRELGISSEVINFVPANNDKVELMKVIIKNLREEKIEFTPTAAVPIYGRSADNIRDHRHVTSLLNRITTNDYGIVVKPTLTFDERGHRLNSINYVVQASMSNGDAPIGFFPIVEDFIGEGGNLLWPEAVVKNNRNFRKSNESLDGYEAIGGIRFNDISLCPGETASFIIIMGISEEQDTLKEFVVKYGSSNKFDSEFKKNNEYWNNKLDNISFKSSDSNFDFWMKWVELQPILRRIYGCSFLPHHDYGKGGRGWRDLWQDCLALLLVEPKQVKELLINNYGGVRLDGSNATIIGAKPGEFIADRNNIPRTWMDHGAWPYFATRLYIDLSGDLEFLFIKQIYFKDHLHNRSKQVDKKWTKEYGNNLRDKNNRVYKGTILEHVLLQQITAFYNVGEHNNMKIEGGDWNDGFDMASGKGESVAFTALYGSNLMDLSKLLLDLQQRLNIEEIEVAKEILILIDSITEKINYDSVEEKNSLLNKYFEACSHTISGEKVKLKIEEISLDLKNKALWIKNHIIKNEWITNRDGFEWFNGYYDNSGEMLEGGSGAAVRMTLTGQVFPIMGGIADEEHIEKIVTAVNKYLRDEKVGGVRLNTNFNEVKLNMGRCFGFAYGHKENGAMFSHMAVMYINSLYKRGFVKDGYEILRMLYNHSVDFDKSRILPGIPEYFNERGRGMYPYLTGAASWLLLTMRNEVYGVQGLLGDLLLQPKLMKDQFNNDASAAIFTVFRDKKINIKYKNVNNLEYGVYRITKVILNGKSIKDNLDNDHILIDKKLIDELECDKCHELLLELT